MIERIKSYYLSRAELQRLHVRALRAQRLSQMEVCGLVLIDKRGSLSLAYLNNQSVHVGSYSVDVKTIQLFEARLRERSRKRVFGFFHSHPISEAVPGRADLAQGFYQGVELIYDVCGREARLWRKHRQRNGKLCAVELPLKGGAE